MIIPIMGTLKTMDVSAAPTALADVLFTPVQQRVLGLLFGQPARRFQSAELIRLAHSGTGATHRLLRRLAETGLVQKARKATRSTTKRTPTPRCSKSSSV